MRYIDEFRNSELIRPLVEELNAITTEMPLNFMEVCGTHTMAISRFGIRQLVPKNIRLLSGPGCPVCVTPDADIKQAIEIALTPGCILTTFGDMLRVPTASGDSLAKARSRGARVEIVYSTLDAIKIARDNCNDTVVFFAAGFETTAPTIAAGLKIAEESEVDNFRIYSVMKLVPPALIALLDSNDVKIDGFILPGHVSAVLGSKAYEIISDVYGIPCAISGFEPVDILLGLLDLVKQVKADEAQVDIQYSRVVTYDGNDAAIRILYEYFEMADSVWRGIGVIPQSGLRLRPEYAHRNASAAAVLASNLSGTDDLSGSSQAELAKGCLCGEILCGKSFPSDCALFGTVCTEENPIGPCMVSREGTCSAYYKYELSAR